MPESAKRIWQLAIEIVVEVCCSVVEGTVTLQTLAKMEGHPSNLHHLCEAITSKRSAGNVAKPTKSPRNWLKWTYNDIALAIQKRRSEHDDFRKFHQDLCHFFTHLGNLDIQGLEYLNTFI